MRKIFFLFFNAKFQCSKCIISPMVRHQRYNVWELFFWSKELWTTQKHCIVCTAGICFPPKQKKQFFENYSFFSRKTKKCLRGSIFFVLLGFCGQRRHFLIFGARFIMHGLQKNILAKHIQMAFCHQFAIFHWFCMTIGHVVASLSLLDTNLVFCCLRVGHFLTFFFEI